MSRRPLRVPRLRVILIGVALVFGCLDAERHHPSPEGLVRPQPPSFTVRIPREAEVSGHRHETPPPELDSGSSQLVIGSWAGDDLTQFGRISASAIYNDRIFVVDNYFSEVRLFDVLGNPMARIGGRGEGPGEFRSPVALAQDDSGRVLVFDGDGRVSYLREFNGQLGAALLFRFPGVIVDGCVMGDGFFIHGLLPGSGSVVHRYSVDGRHITSFAEVYRTENRVIRSQVSLGRIACLAETGSVLLAPELLPELRAYAPEGDLLWWALLDGHLPIELVEIARGSMMRATCSGHHSLWGLTRSGEGDRALLQVGYGSSCRGEQQVPVLHTFLIDQFPDGFRYLGSHIPSILYWDSLYAIEHQIEPFPAIRLRSPRVGLTKDAPR